MPILNIRKGSQTGTTIELSTDNVVIGRDKNDAVCITDQSASRHHAEVFRIGELYFVRDLESKNGTFLNEEQITEQSLKFGDRIRIGGTVLVFEEGMTPAQSVEDSVHYDLEEMSPASATMEIDFKKREEGNSIESKQLEVLFKISKLMGSIHGIKILFEKVLKLLLEAIDADNGYIFRLNDDNNLRPVMVLEKDTDKSAKVSKSVIKRVMENHKALLTQDAAMDPRFETSNSIILKKTSGVICAPLISLEEIVGVIYLSVARVGTPFKNEDLELCSVVAILLGMATQTVEHGRKEKESLMNTVKSLVDIIERRFPKRKGHIKRVVQLCEAMGIEMKLQGEDLFLLTLSAWLHDIGKIASTDDIDIYSDESVSKDKVRAILVERSKIAREIVDDMNIDSRVLDAIVHHTEKLDGSGVPDALYGLDIPLFARVICVAKQFDLDLNYGGTHGIGLPVKDCLIKANKASGKEIDTEVVQALLLAYRKGRLTLV